MPLPRPLLRTFAAALVAALALAAPPARAQGVKVALSPAIIAVPPGASFAVDVAVTQAGAAFNAADVVVGWDPAVLTLQPLAPLQAQVGCLMTGACSAACGQTFHNFASAPDSADAAVALLCAGASLTGPGQVYTLHFQAANVVQATILTIRRARFADDGLYVAPVSTTNAVVYVSAATPSRARPWGALKAAYR